MTQPQPDSIKGLREEILEILPPSIYNDLTITQLLKLIQKAVTEAELKARIDELILFPVKGEPGYEDLPKYRLARLATLMNQDKVG